MIPARYKHNRPISQLCFGTVQLGIPYGIANRTGMPDERAATHMLATACDAGITMFDTARAYGESEQRVGLALRHRDMNQFTIMTKLSPLGDVSDSDSAAFLRTKVEESVHASLQYIGLSSLPYLLLHRSEHLHVFQGAIWQQLLALRKQGLIGRLGVSVASPQEAFDALSFPEVECLQLPYNILDARWERAGIPTLLSKRPDVLVLSRSALLQGLLRQDTSVWPVISPSEATTLVHLLDGWVTQFERQNRTDLCLAFVRGQIWIDSVIVGMETIQQLHENLEMFQTPPLSPEACMAIRKNLPHVNESLLNPAYWPKKQG